MIIDELGYLPMPAEAASHLFQDATPAIAILDRLLHHATVVSINDDSYRMRTQREAIRALRPAITGGEKP